MIPDASRSFIAALVAEGPAPDRAEKMRLYGWLVGRWEMDALLIAEDGSEARGRGEVHAGFVLEGRAIQDVWILPGAFFGTTLRVYDPGLDAWHILWNDPLKQLYVRQLGRAQGADIVQEGTDEAGIARRWRFSDLTPDSFRWRGEVKASAGAEWRLQADFRVRRA